MGRSWFFLQIVQVQFPATPSGETIKQQHSLKGPEFAWLLAAWCLPWEHNSHYLGEARAPLCSFSWGAALVVLPVLESWTGDRSWAQPSEGPLGT